MKPLTVRKFSYEYIQGFLDHEAFYFGKILSFLPFTEIFRIIGLGSAYDLWSNGLVIRVLVPNVGFPGSKLLGGSEIDLAFHLSEMDQMSTRTSWGLNGKK